jgi:hypothetical protein
MSSGVVSDGPDHVDVKLAAVNYFKLMEAKHG